MPFKSEAQRVYMHAKHPEIAKRWEAETTGKLPARVASKGADPELVKTLKRLETRGQR